MARKTTHQLAYTAIRIEGGLLPADELTRLTTLAAPEQTEQTDAHYQIPRGLKLRDEIARHFKIAQSLWQDFAALRQRTDAPAHRSTVQAFLLPLLRQVLGFAELQAFLASDANSTSDNSYQIPYAAWGGSLPLVLAGHDQPLDQASDRFGHAHPDTGRIRRRSPHMLAQEALNASDHALWAIASNGLKLRILRDNPSLTRPAYIEVDLEAIFTEDLYADFTAFWLLAHASRFGKAPPSGQTTEAANTADTTSNPAPNPADCPWERWRNAGQRSGETVRTNLRYQVADALRSLGTGFLSHPGNIHLRNQLLNAEQSSATKQAFFEELLSLVYRFIFLATVEDRTDPTTGRSLVFTPDATDEQQQRYWQGYSLTWLRERAVRRSAHDTHSDLWQALSITFNGLATGQPSLGLPALGGLFAPEQCPLLTSAHIANRHLLAAVFQLGYFRQATGLTRVNYRDMGAEELGSVYESLLELVPDIQHLAQPHAARLGFVGDDDQVTGADASTRGNARKLTGSYYTPDSLVQQLITSALEPVIAQTVQAHPANPEQALLQLTVCDPACGSGHFLLAAARRLAAEVAHHRAAALGGAPTPADYRHALRDVVGHCIYGVDKNPMAIALAKTALWLEAYTPDRPLTFIDHHLQVGDALLGLTDLKALELGIAKDAYKTLSGDDKEVCKQLAKTNAAALKDLEKKRKARAFGQLDVASSQDSGLKPMQALEALPENSTQDIAAKKAAHSAFLVQAKTSRLAHAADLLVGAYLLPKREGAETRIPTSATLYLTLLGVALPTDQQGALAAAQTACAEARVLHWPLAFPQVFADGGFDCVLGNPPWERIKLQEEEFFATRHRDVAEAKNKAERSQRIQWLAEGMLAKHLFPELEHAFHKCEAEQRLYGEFISARRTAEAASVFAHIKGENGGRYPLTGVGDVNTYALFAETIRQITAPTGRAGFIVPSGLATDNSTKDFFGDLISTRSLDSFFEFENEGFFPGAGQGHMLRFALTTIVGAAQKISATRYLFQGKKLEHLNDTERVFTLSSEDIERVNPNTLTCPIFQSRHDAELTKKIYQRVSVLIREARGDEPEKNPWGIRFMAMFHMSNDSHLFKTYQDLKSDGYELRANHFVRGADCYVPLYESKMIQLYTNRHGDFQDSNHERAHILPSIPKERLADKTYVTMPYYWVSQEDVKERLSEFGWEHQWFLAWRNVTDSRASARTLVTSAIPFSGVGNSLPVYLPVGHQAKEAALLLANMSSLVLDYSARMKVGGLNFNFFIFKQLPIIEPTRYSRDDMSFILPRVVSLTCNAEDMRPFLNEIYPDRDIVVFDEGERAKVQAELDAYYAKLYGLSREELQFVLEPESIKPGYPSETFSVLKRNEEREFGEYRTQRLVLEAWDKLERGELH